MAHLDNCGLCQAEPKNQDFLWLVKREDGERSSVHVLAPSKNQAIVESGWQDRPILYAIAVKAAPAPMPESAKEALRLAAAARRAKKSNGLHAYSSRLAERREKKTMAKTKGENGPRGKIFVLGHSATAFVRYLGTEDFNLKETKAVLEALGVDQMPTDNCIRTFLYAGKKGQRGAPAELSAEQKKQVKDARANLKLATVKGDEEKKADAKASKASAKKKAAKKKTAAKQPAKAAKKDCSQESRSRGEEQAYR